MARRKLKMKNMASWIMMLISMIVAIAIGGSFVSGLFLNVVLLKFLPLIVHQVVGWIIVIGAVWGGIMSLVNY